MGIVRTEDALTNNRKTPRLIEFIKKYGIVFNHVKLSSNIETDYYYDLKKVSFHPTGANLLGELLLKEVTKYRARSVGGLEIGAIALATAVVMRSTKLGKYKKGLNGFFIRKNPKTHGLEKKIEGEVIEPVVIVDDVITSGKSVMDAIEAVNKDGFNVKGVVCVIDREEEGTTNLLKQNNIVYSSLFRHSDFKSFVEERLKKNKQNLIV